MTDKKIKILAVDDNVVNIKVLSQYLLKQNYDVVTAESGEEAIELFQSNLPDIILMDVMMGGISGLEATEKIKVLAGDTWIPVIFMSALASEEDKIKGLEVGGDDYVTKPIEFNVLGAKLKAVQRIADMQLKLSEAMDKLQEYKNVEETEQEMAYDLMEGLFDRGHHLAGKDFHIWHIPATLFSGDLIVANKSSDSRLYLLHADSTGHGLTAALPLLPVSQTFYQMSSKGFSVGSMAQEMNKQLKFIMPINRFVAVTIMLLDFDNNMVEVWNGGNPTVYVLNENKEVVKKIEPTHLALGIMPDEDFDKKTEFVSCEGNNTVVLYSDGLIEAKNKDGAVFDEEQLINIFHQDDTNEPPNRYRSNAVRLRNKIVDAVSDHLDGEPAHDDMSLIVVDTQK